MPKRSKFFNMRLTLDSLAVLDAIDRKGSFAAAAVELFRVPSAITYTVRKLERDLDVALFRREGRRALLTPAGRELLESGRRLLRAATEAEHRVRRIATGWENELRIAVDTIVPLRAMLPLIAAFHRDCRDRQAAHTRLRFATEVLGGTWDALVHRRADLVIGASGDPPSGGGYRLRALAEVTMLFAVAPGHPLARQREPLATGDIVQFRAVVAADSSRDLVPRSVGLLDGQDTLTMPDLPSKIAAQVAGLGCGFVPAHLAAVDIAAGRLVVRQVEDAAPSGRMFVAWRSEKPGKALAWWIDAVASSSLGQHLASGAASPAAKTAPRQSRPRARTRAN
ncbi:MAG: LysR family transcriptional regulator [Betaproteobacteria bacterium]